MTKTDRDASDEKLPTNEMAWNYFADKSDYRLSNDYYKVFGPYNDKYQKLYREFVNKDFQSDDDNRDLYKKLQLWEKRNSQVSDEPLGTLTVDANLHQLDFLHQVSDIDLLHPDRNSGYEANQKWHLFVGVFGYVTVCAKGIEGTKNEKISNWGNPNNYPNENFFRTRNNAPYPSPILRLWIVENVNNSAFRDEFVTPISEILEASLLIKAQCDNTKNSSCLTSQENQLKSELAHCENALRGKNHHKSTYGLINIAFNTLINNWDKYTEAD
ncbi:hypothetical protein [Lacticaseibacillus nasuensis]|uniref:hypothetical protein n=1 Tax=Lacticaseibacillus nasuensis TaxID=944671 RepID=UPI0022469DD9|nr:hypothetical protein [Lacticaseibacillus nasuensis]MCX2455002.1 hypothetical protein [Lacticaseibacillus nasuensis]